MNKRRKEEKKKRREEEDFEIYCWKYPKDLRINKIKEEIKERGEIDINSIEHCKKRKRILFVKYKVIRIRVLPLHTNRTFVEFYYIIEYIEDGDYKFNPFRLNLAHS